MRGHISDIHLEHHTFSRAEGIHGVLEAISAYVSYSQCFSLTFNSHNFRCSLFIMHGKI